MGRPWTDEEISILVSMWPDASIVQIAKRLPRAYHCVYCKIKWLCEKGLLEAKNNPRRPINPGLKDFNKAKMDYCRKHNMTIAQLLVRLKDDDQLRAELYRLAVALIRPASRRAGNSAA